MYEILIKEKFESKVVEFSTTSGGFRDTFYHAAIVTTRDCKHENSYNDNDLSKYTKGSVSRYFRFR